MQAGAGHARTKDTRLRAAARKPGKDTRTKGLCRHQLCCRLCLCKRAQCPEQGTRRGIVCGSPRILPCRTGWHPLTVSPLPVAQLLDKCCRFQQICSNKALFIRHCQTALPARCRSPHLWMVRGSPHQISNFGAGSRSSYQIFSNCHWSGDFIQNW